MTRNSPYTYIVLSIVCIIAGVASWQSIRPFLAERHFRDGYYLMHTGNGQADSTTEFMFGIKLAYEIKKGKLGNAITDTTVSGTAISMLKTVDAVSDDMYWECNGYCGKKQPMVVSLGGPALRAQVHLGGE